MFDTHLNFAIGTVLSAPADASGQDFTLMPGDGQAFAANMPVTMCPRDVKSNGSNSEIGYITAIDGDALTILRAQERSIPMQVAANWQIFGSITAKTVTDIEEAVADKAGTADLDALEAVVAGKADVAALDALEQAVAAKADKTELFSGDYIDLRNKPTLGTAAATNATDYATAAQGAKADTAVQPAAISNVDNTSDLNKPISNPTQAALDNKADLVNGMIPESQLPSFVDDVLTFDTLADFPTAGGDGKIYITRDTNRTYRWTGIAYAEISSSIALGETSSTAYRGDRGKTAYDHTLKTDNPHGVTKAQVGLGSVDNTSDTDKPVSTAQAAALATKANASTTVNLTGAQTIAGVKTFTSSPVVPTATTGAQAVNKAQVDALVPIYGFGQPNGVVTAPAGSTYKNTDRDPATWTGDMVWEKRSGSSNTGWVCVSGDTGWRQVNGLLLSDGFVYYRRVGAEVSVALGGGTFDSIRLATDASVGSRRRVIDTNQIPTGFKLSRSQTGLLTVNSEFIVGTIYVSGTSDGSYIELRNSSKAVVTTEYVRPQVMSAYTSEAWPTTLPGIASI